MKRVLRPRFHVLITLFLTLTVPVIGQVDTVSAGKAYPYDPVIEERFRNGLEHWQNARYGEASDDFRFVALAPENRRTTAAMLMGGRALIAEGKLGQGVGMLQSLVERYPESRYVQDAKETVDLASQRLDLLRQKNQEVFTVGVLLPMTERALRFTQAMFTGIRIAVDEFNSRGGREVRIVFENSGGSPEAARAAAQRLIGRASPRVIIGPLFSEEAAAAAEVAEEAGYPLIVPLATDGAVTAGRKFVFQANPTYDMRGRLMARHAVQRLRANRLGVIADSTSFAGRMAEGFKSEAEDLEADILIDLHVSNIREWYGIDRQLTPDTLTYVKAVYVPVTGDDAGGVIAIALNEIDRLHPSLRIVGNGEWAGFQDEDLMQKHRVVYGTDFKVDSLSVEVVQFAQEFRSRSDRDPDQTAFVGYDVARFLLELVSTEPTEGDFADVLRSGVSYDGLSARLFFGDGQVNQSLFFETYEVADDPEGN